ncbi:MAG: class I SAM-dependent methyltransferase [Bacteroidota bacterium]
MTSFKEYVASNKEAWERTANKYEADIEQDVAFLRNGGINQLEAERRILGDLAGVQCAIHLQCSHGLDALSLLNMGVREVVGVDISKEMLGQAQRKSEALGAPAQWIESDVLSVPASLNHTADLVYTGRGALPWVHDLDAWAGVVVRLLKPGGRLFVHEGHPLTWVWHPEANTYQLDPGGRGYFDTRARPNEDFPAAATAQYTPEGEAVPTAWEWQWTIGEVVTAVVKAGLLIEHLEEHADHFWDQYPDVAPEMSARLPHTYSLLARVPGP